MRPESSPLNAKGRPRYPVHKRRSERGSNLLELPLILLPFLGLVFAICDFGLAIFIQNTVQNAVREGVRYAITYQTASGLCQDASIKQAVQTASMGFVSSASNVTVAYYVPTDLTNAVAAPAGNAPGNVVEVSVAGLQRQWIAPIYRTPGTYSIAGRSSDVMQGLPTGTAAPCR
jgi:Flp pilus assembly protein TadG